MKQKTFAPKGQGGCLAITELYDTLHFAFLYGHYLPTMMIGPFV